MKNRFIYLLLIFTFSYDCLKSQFDNVELNFNLGNSFRTLVLNYENGGTGAVLASRKDNEKRALSISPQLLIGSDLGKNIELKYGIGLVNYKYILNIDPLSNLV